MTVEVERSFDVETSQGEVWDLLANDENRARAIDVVARFEDDGDETIWYVKLPGPLSSRTMAVRTWDLERDPPGYVKFVGRSRVTTRNPASTVDSIITRPVARWSAPAT